MSFSRSVERTNVRKLYHVVIASAVLGFSLGQIGKLSESFAVYSSTRKNDALSSKAKVFVTPRGVSKNEYDFLIVGSLVGKSCSVDKTWVCRDCGLERKYLKWEDCPIITERKNICPKREVVDGWDKQPRQSSTQGPHGEHLHRLTHYGMGATSTRYPCEEFQDCFDLKRCMGSNKISVKVLTGLPVL